MIYQHKNIQSYHNRKKVSSPLLYSRRCFVLFSCLQPSCHSVAYGFYDMFLTLPIGQWLLFPTHLLFPTSNVVFFKAGYHVTLPEPLAVCFQQAGLLFMSMAALFVCYIAALRYLPAIISKRFIVFSTMLLGLCLLLIPVATSQDVFSYIIYARLDIIYHLNPLTALPKAIPYDPIYPRVYWVKQPSAYGPTWALLSSSLQWFALRIGLKNPLYMVLLLRLLTLAAHLGSTQLIWSISGAIQRASGASSLKKRILATLAFAWNPLLLIEACVNAHNDIIMLFFVLLALWVLVQYQQNPFLRYATVASLLAVAACLKITLVLLAPGLLLYIISQRSHYSRTLQGLSLATIAYVGTIVALYAPFWQHGAILHILQLNPGVMHTINTPYEFLIHLYASFHKVYIAPASLPHGSHIEVFAHQVSIVLFTIAYLSSCIYYWRALKKTGSQDNIGLLLRWMTLIWFFYCLLGSPWFWPWYAVTFFGLYALTEATSKPSASSTGYSTRSAVRILSFSLLSVYCFLTIAAFKSTIAGLPHFQWSYLAGPWIWLLPLLMLFLSYKRSHIAKSNDR